MDKSYIIYEENSDKETQSNQMDILFNRVSRVSSILFDKEPTKIPFEFKFPILDPLEQNVFLEECRKYHLFNDLPLHYKEKIFLAEQVYFYNDKFLKYIFSKGVSETEFSNKNPKTKLDFFYGFLFKNQMDIGILNLENYNNNSN